MRALLFWGLCIPARTYLSTLGDSVPLRLFATVAAYRWLSGLEDGDVGAFGGPAWWREERYTHGVLWALYAVSGESVFLKADTVFGGVNWLVTLDS